MKSIGKSQSLCAPKFSTDKGERGRDLPTFIPWAQREGGLTTPSLPHSPVVTSVGIERTCRHPSSCFIPHSLPAPSPRSATPYARAFLPLLMCTGIAFDCLSIRVYRRRTSTRLMVNRAAVGNYGKDTGLDTAGCDEEIGEEEKHIEEPFPRQLAIYIHERYPLSTQYVGYNLYVSPPNKDHFSTLTHT